jgi:hypothetical protein
MEELGTNCAQHLPHQERRDAQKELEYQGFGNTL